MNIKIQCGCGAKYVLDVTPAHIGSGVQLICQACGSDNSRMLQQVLQQQFAPMGVLEPAAHPAFEPAAPGNEVAAVGVPTEPTPLMQAEVQMCRKHPGCVIESECVVCRKPLCALCLEHFGYICSPFCKEKAESKRIPVPQYAGQRMAVERNYWRHVKIAAWSIAAVVLVLLAAGGWYLFVGSKPRVAWSIKLPPSDYGGYCKLVTPTQLMVWHGDRLARYDLQRRRELWSTPLLDKTQLAAQAASWLARHGEDADIQLGKRNPWDRSAKRQQVKLSDVEESLRAGVAMDLKVRLIGESVWVLFPDRLVQFEWATGKPGKTVPFTDRIERFETSRDALFVITVDDLGRENLARIDGQTGQLTEQRVPAVTPPTQSTKKPTAAGSFETGVFLRPFRSALINAGQNFVLIGVTLVEAKIAQHRAMEEKSGKGALDREISVGNSGQAVEDFMNEQQREATGGIRHEDESRYAVTLKRVLGESAADWSGEVSGRPDLYALDTVDILTAGKSIRVFDKANTKLWESTLGFSMAQRSILATDPYAEEFVTPAVEHGNRLYFFDPGVLTCFELATGKVLWRLQAVGVSGIQFDDKGTLYVAATSAGVDALRYSQQTDFSRNIHPMILKVDPRNGKILWDIPKRVQAFRIAGKFIYAIEATKGGGGSLMRPAAPEHMWLYRLEPESGSSLWDHYDKRMPLSWDCSGNVIPLLFRDEIQVLKFLSL